jgi:hypothetical protein
VTLTGDSPSAYPAREVADVKAASRWRAEGCQYLGGGYGNAF